MKRNAAVGLFTTPSKIEQGTLLRLRNPLTQMEVSVNYSKAEKIELELCYTKI
jgi:hypothetical protein